MEKYDPRFVRELLERYPAGTEVEKALNLAEMYGKRKEFEVALRDHRNGGVFRSSGKSIADLLDNVCYNGNPRVYSVDNSFLAVEKIQCVDAEKNVFEQYDQLFISKDVVRSNDGEQVNFNPYRAIVHFEKEGSLFLPSFALSCNIAAALYQHRDEPEVKPVLMQYQNHGAGYGWHVQNTVINWDKQKVIHYPHKNDFTVLGGETEINQLHQRTLLPFIRKEKRIILPDRTLSDMTLENGLKDPLMFRFLRQLTGLVYPSILVHIGKYFDNSAKVWTSSSNGTKAAWLGCSDDNFTLDGDSNLIGSNAARGVRKI